MANSTSLIGFPTAGNIGVPSRNPAGIDTDMVGVYGRESSVTRARRLANTPPKLGALTLVAASVDAIVARDERQQLRGFSGPRQARPAIGPSLGVADQPGAATSNADAPT